MNIWSSFMVALQNIGKSLMLPVSSLPIAAILLRFGQVDMLNMPALSAAGSAVFGNLPLIFAMGVSIGFSKKNKSTAAFTGAISFLIFKDSLATFSVATEGIVGSEVVIVEKAVDMAVLGGIMIGSLSGLLSDYVVNWKVPAFLGFFSGSRLVPIISGLIAFVLAFIFGYIWPPIQVALDNLGVWITGAGVVGLFVYGFLNRMLIITGLHHMINSLVWFVFGSYTNSVGEVFYGDLNRYLAGDPTGGFFTAGMYPIMLFGLPAAAIAMIVAAKPCRKKAVSSVILSSAFASFLTGITEPIEFSFMLIAPFLYLLHASLTGISSAVTGFFDIHLGFGFSAGLIDYLLMSGLPAQSNAWMLWPIGMVFGAVYFVLFVSAIKLFNIKTPGRESENEDYEGKQLVPEESTSYDAIIHALGGINNIISTTFCITRLRLELSDATLVDEEALKVQGAKGVVQPGGKGYQVVFGSRSEKISTYIETCLKRQ